MLRPAELAREARRVMRTPTMKSLALLRKGIRVGRGG